MAMEDRYNRGYIGDQIAGGIDQLAGREPPAMDGGQPSALGEGADQQGQPPDQQGQPQQAAPPPGPPGGMHPTEVTGPDGQPVTTTICQKGERWHRLFCPAAER
jgi:hypothetical protein